MTATVGSHALVRGVVLLFVVLAGLGAALVGGAAPSAQATSYVPISGAGSTWSQNALDQWRRNVNQYGMQVNYQGTGSSDGRNQFRNGTVDFAVTEIPYGLKDNGVVDPPPSRHFAYMPIVAGGTAFMYNINIAGHRVTNLRLSGATIAKIFTGVITRWDDPAIKADNPALALPARQITPVVRSDGSGTTAQFTLWMSKEYPSLWNSYCGKAGYVTPCTQTSTYPVIPGTRFTALSGSLGVSGYVSQAQSEGSITYVEYSYALNTGFPVVKVLNAAGYYNQPTAANVAVALLAARINNDPSSRDYLTQILDGVYTNNDPRTYPLSSYSYMILPTAVEGSFNTAKGRTLSDFADYFLCEGQQQAPVLGYSPLPINLVSAGLDQVRRIPGVDPKRIDIRSCNNPTFSSDGSNTLAKTAPQPPACDRQGSTQCVEGTGGARAATPVSSGHGGATRSGQTVSGSLGGATTSTGGSVTGSGGSTSVAGGGAATTTGGAQAAKGATHIDPSTGQVVSGGTTTTGTASSTDGGAISAVPVTVAAEHGWTGQDSLMALAVALLAGLVVAPPLVSRYFASRSSS